MRKFLMSLVLNKVVSKLDDQMDGVELGQELSRILEEKFGEKGESLVEKGLVQDFFSELLEGLNMDDMKEYVYWLQAEGLRLGEEYNLFNEEEKDDNVDKAI